MKEIINTIIKLNNVVDDLSKDNDFNIIEEIIVAHSIHILYLQCINEIDFSITKNIIRFDEIFECMVASFRTFLVNFIEYYECSNDEDVNISQELRQKIEEFCREANPDTAKYVIGMLREQYQGVNIKKNEKNIQNKNVHNLVKLIYDVLFDSLNFEYRKRIKLINMINYENDVFKKRDVIPNYYSINAKLFRMLSCISICILNKKSFIDFVKAYIESILREIQENYKFILSLNKDARHSGYINELEIKGRLNKINSYFGTRTIGNNIYLKSKKRCFAIMIADSEKYFTFSSIYDYKGSCNLITAEMKKAIDDAITEVKNNILDNTYTYVCLTNNTKRFVDCKGFQSNSKNPVNFIKDLQNVAFERFISESYSCCERKLIDVLGNAYRNISFYVRYLPCYKCIDAIYQQIDKTNDLEVYTLYKYPFSGERLKNVINKVICVKYN